jgi:citrate lyase subunit beta/citryl-CoA lyase
MHAPDRAAEAADERAACREAVAEPRSYLFVPGNRPERFDKAMAAGAHAVIVDLEDAVPPAGKDAARAAVGEWLSASRPVLLRINAAGTPWFDADLRMAVERAAGLAGVVLPKTDDPEDAARVVHAIGPGMPVLPLIETARGLWNAVAIGRSASVQRLVFGSIDFQLDLGIADDELVAYRSQLVLASRVADLAAPVDGITTAIDDTDTLRREAQRARAQGFGGKLCIHPKQVAVVNEAFRPTAAEIAWARRIVGADAAAGGAAVAVDGKMVDHPVLLRARAILVAADQ